MLSPLNGISSLSDLLSLSYFDFLACMGEFPIHPRAAQATQEVINAAKVRIGERILEIGCGTGTTTKALIRAGGNVTILEKSSRMIAATLRNCRMSGLPLPKYFLGTAEDLSCLLNNHYDFVLYQCVLGFVEDKTKALSECNNVLFSERGRIGVVDLHYIEPPPVEILSELENIFSTPIVPLFEEDWKSLFADFELNYWGTYDLPDVFPPTPEQIKKLLEKAKLLEQISFIDEDALIAISKKWAGWEHIFCENRKFLRSHVATWNVK